MGKFNDELIMQNEEIRRIIDVQSVDELKSMLPSCSLENDVGVITASIEAKKSDEFIEMLIDGGAPLITRYKSNTPTEYALGSAILNKRDRICEKISNTYLSDFLEKKFFYGWDVVREALSYCNPEYVDKFFEKYPLGNCFDGMIQNKNLSKSTLSKIIDSCCSITGVIKSSWVNNLVHHPNMDSYLDNQLVNIIKDPGEKEALRVYIKSYREEQAQKQNQKHTEFHRQDIDKELKRARDRLENSRNTLSGIVIADKIAEEMISGKEKRTITREVGKELADKYKREYALSKKQKY